MTQSLDGAASVARTERLAAELREQGLDALLVDAPADLRYLTGYTGSNGLALVYADGSRPNRFLTDFRYTEQSRLEVLGPYDRETVTGELRDAAAGLLGGEGKLAFDEDKLTVKAHARLAEALGAGWRLAGATGLIERLRLVKEDSEVALIAAACQLADEALSAVLERGLVGRTEQEVAFDLEMTMRKLGAEAPSFASIVAAGSHGALPHAHPREVQIERDVLVTIDWGALHQGYCSDCTRTYATGEAISDQAREVYELVLEAQQAALDALRAGPSGRELDAVARGVIDEAGYGERFGHGLGHGVGLEVHEAPRLSRTAGEEPLPAGSVVTVEPGVYLPGTLGVRIEDLAVLRAEGHERLTALPKELAVVS